MPLVESLIVDLVEPVVANLLPEPSANVVSSGGRVRNGEQFTVFYSPGGLTGKTTVTLGGIACTGVSVTDDQNMVATAPSDDLLHVGPYTLDIT